MNQKNKNIQIHNNILEGRGRKERRRRGRKERRGREERSGWKGKKGGKGAGIVGNQPSNTVSHMHVSEDAFTRD